MNVRRIPPRLAEMEIAAIQEAMRLIDILTSQYASFRAEGLRASAWKLDSDALAQLRREATADRTDVPGTKSPITFLGVPVEQVAAGTAVQADSVASTRRLVPCQRLDRGGDRQWDLFDLDTVKASDASFASKEDAEVVAVRSGW